MTRKRTKGLRWWIRRHIFSASEVNIMKGMSREDKKRLYQFANERSHLDSQFANEHGRAAGQALILINGGAATATLALLAKDIPQNNVNAAQVFLKLIDVAPACLGGYAMGAAAGALMMYCMNRALDNWNTYWRTYLWRSIDLIDRRQVARTHARIWWIGTNIFAVLSALSFVIACGKLARALW